MFSTCYELAPRAPIPDGRMERFMHPCFAGVTKFHFLFFEEKVFFFLGHPKTHLLLLAQMPLGFHHFAGFTFFHALFLASKPILVSFASAVDEHFARHQRRVKTPPEPHYVQYAQYSKYAEYAEYAQYAQYTQYTQYAQYTQYEQYAQYAK